MMRKITSDARFGAMPHNTDAMVNLAVLLADRRLHLDDSLATAVQYADDPDDVSRALRAACATTPSRPAR